MSEWIAIKDQLPLVDNPNGGESAFVLMTDGKSISVGSYQAEYFIENDPNRFEAQTTTYSSEMWYCEGYMEKPTHWMPIPKMPDVYQTPDIYISSTIQPVIKKTSVTKEKNDLVKPALKDGSISLDDWVFENNMTLSEVAKKINYGLGYLCQCKNGSLRMSKRTKYLIKKFTKGKVDYL